jgi:hypothetical protein
MANEVTKTMENGLVDPTQLENMAWGADDVEASDIRIPRLQLMQAMSEKVAEGDKQPGQIIETSMGMTVAEKGKSINLIPFYIFKDWAIHKKINGKFEWFSREEYTLKNSNKPREEVINGEEYKNFLGINVLAMVESEINDPSALPVVVTFRSTSLKTGQDISTLGIRAQSVNKPLASFTISLGTKFTKNDKGNFFVYEVQKVKPTENFQEIGPRIFKWYETFKAGKAKLDAESETPETGISGVPSDAESRF